MLYTKIAKKVLMSKLGRKLVVAGVMKLASSKKGRETLWKLRGVLPASMVAKATAKHAAKKHFKR